MSRIGKLPVVIPEKIQVQVKQSQFLVEGPKGKLNFEIPAGVTVEVRGEDKKIVVQRSNDSKEQRALHGLVRSIIHNMVLGVTQGFEKGLEIEGIGFRAQVQGKQLTLVVGFTHPVELAIPDGITVETPKPTQVLVKGADKAKVGQFAAMIRAVFPPEPYKGKGIRYAGEKVRRKAGKSVAKTAA